MSATWHKRFRSLCDHVAAWSEDCDFKVGCVIVGPGHTVLSLGWNGLPRGVEAHDPMRLDRQSGEKFHWVEHAERNTIYNAARNGVALQGASLYVNRFPCADCARAIAQSGIAAVHCPPIPAFDGKLDHSFQVSAQILNESGIRVEADARGDGEVSEGSFRSPQLAE